MTSYSESDIANQAMEWLRERGYTCYGEVPFRGYTIDIVGITASDTIIIEAKKNLTRGVVVQAHRAQLYANKVYCAVGAMPRNVDRCAKAGIGILYNGVEILAPGEDIHFEQFNTKLLSNLADYQQDRQAGIPNGKGRGPAQEVAAAVLNYHNPEADWKELFNNVPNHYDSYKSMRSALRVHTMGRRQRQGPLR